MLQHLHDFYLSVHLQHDDINANSQLSEQHVTTNCLPIMNISTKISVKCVIRAGEHHSEVCSMLQCNFLLLSEAVYVKSMHLVSTCTISFGLDRQMTFTQKINGGSSNSNLPKLFPCIIKVPLHAGVSK